MRHCARCGTPYPTDERFCPLDGAPIVEQRAAGDPFVGHKLGDRYLLLRAIGKGGMGAVYEAEHVGLGKRVAVKLLLDQFSEDREVLARFHQEARTASRVGHENIIDILDIGDHDGRSYIVMEYLAGRDLRRAFLDGHGPMSVERALPILKQITRGLHAAHTKGVIHRDMKPENVFLTDKHGDPDFVKIMDFGISKIKAAHDSQVRLTQTGAVIGTPMYMAPEQGMGRTDIDHRADVYSVGVMMFELLCGKPPFDATTYLGLMTQHLQTPPPPPRTVRPDLPPVLEAIILRALEKEPARRWQSIKELGDALPTAATTPRSTVRDGSGALSAPLIAAASAPVAMPAPTQSATVARDPRGRGRTTLIIAIVVLAAAVAAAAIVVPRLRRAEPVAAGVAPGAVVDAGAAKAAGPQVQAIETSGSLEVDSTPKNATVFVDDVELGHTPLVIEKVAAGPHRLRLELDGYEYIAVDKQVRAGTAETFFGAMSRNKKGGRGSKPPVAPPPSPHAAAGTPDAGPAAVRPPPPPTPVRDVDPRPDAGTKKPNPYLKGK